MHVPTGGVPSSVPEKSGWGFWKNEGKKKGGFGLPTPSQIINALPSPSIDDRHYDFSGAGAPYAGAAFPSNLVKSPDARRLAGESLQRSASYTNLPTPTRSTSMPPPDAELETLKKQFKETEVRMKAMTKELAELKQGKLDMEQELENLSQALFEEANKMVADERKKRAEVEESLKEVREEREALRQTIKVLGGQVSEKGDESPPAINVEPAADLPEEFQPRDLDKHYEALRKSIHHVADGSHPFAALSKASAEELDVPPTISESDVENMSNMSMDDAPVDDETPMRERMSIEPPSDPNPWANPSPFETRSSSIAIPGALPGEDKLRQDMGPQGE
jgi:hypothetical protein